MRKARNADGSLLFISDEYLTSQQITSFFSRMAAKKSIQDPMNSDDDEDDDELASAIAENEFDQVRQEIMNEIAIQHPILYKSYNICQMALTSKLSNFSMAMLQDMCKQKETLHRPFAGIGEIMYLSDLAISLFLSSRSNHRFPFQITYVVRPLRASEHSDH